MTSKYLSNIELFYCKDSTESDRILLADEEFLHAAKVLRKKVGDEIYITSGLGEIFHCRIDNIHSKSLEAIKLATHNYADELSNFTICFPPLKNPDRTKFVLEKCTELGITNFIIYLSARSVSKSKNIEKFNRVVIAAMKQSLRAYLPIVHFEENLKELLNSEEEKILFEQSGNKKFEVSNLKKDKNYYLIFGPEGGLTEEEINLFKNVFTLSPNRLRTETAIIKCTSLISDQ